jgi:hypothetical protein
LANYVEVTEGRGCLDDIESIGGENRGRRGEVNIIQKGKEGLCRSGIGREIIRR